MAHLKRESARLLRVGYSDVLLMKESLQSELPLDETGPEHTLDEQRCLDHPSALKTDYSQAVFTGMSGIQTG